MIAALFILSPTVLAILAAVCSPRLGFGVLHGQLFYFAGLLLYSFFPLGVNTLWLVPLAACALFFAGAVMGVFMTRRDINPQNERGRAVLTAFLVLLNCLLLFLLLHWAFKIMCFRLDEAPALPELRPFGLFVKAGGAALLVWLVAGLFLGRRRAGLAAFYAWFGLLFSSYLVLFAHADELAGTMPASLQKALRINSDMEYFTIAENAVFATAMYIIPPLASLVCGVLGYGLLSPDRKRPRRGLFSRRREGAGPT